MGEGTTRNAATPEVFASRLHGPFWSLRGLIDQGGGEALAGVELRECEAVQSRLAAAGEAVNLRPVDVPSADIDAVAAASAQMTEGVRQ